jgi:hypothetical protein
MSIGSLGFAGIGAATPLPQAKGSDADRSVQETAAQKSEQQSDAKAESAAGIGETDGDDHKIEEREGDGRMPWQTPASGNVSDLKGDESNGAPLPSSRDATGQCGNVLDLTG